MGWDSMLLGLAIHLGTGESIDPSFGQQWTGTEDGRRFLTLSGEEWYAANVAFGVDPARRVRWPIDASRRTSARNKLEHVLAKPARPEISSTRCMPRHLSRLRG